MKKLTAWLGQKASAILIVMALLGGGTYAVEIHRIDQHEKCLSSYFQAFAAQSKIRGDLNTASDNSKTAFLDGATASLTEKPTTDKAELAKRAAAFQKLSTDYRAASARVAADRAATPLPKLPDC